LPHLGKPAKPVGFALLAFPNVGNTRNVYEKSQALFCKIFCFSLCFAMSLLYSFSFFS
jgi:hypothetical protein